MNLNTYRMIVLVAALLLSIIYTTKVEAQQSTLPPSKELGLRLSNFNSFGMIYKKLKDEGKFRRIRFAVAQINFASVNGTQGLSLNTQLAIGNEKRRAINEKFDFVYGAEFIGGLRVDAGSGQGALQVSPGVGFVVGFNYAIASDFYVNLELVPSISTTFTVDQDGFRDSFNLNAGFNSQAAALSLVYRFNG